MRKAAMLLAVACSLLFVGKSLPLLADTVLLKSGKELRGKIISQTEGKIRIRFDFGEMEFDMSHVAHMKKESELEYLLSQGDIYLAANQFDKALEKYNLAAEEDKESDEPGNRVSRLWLIKARWAHKKKIHPLALDCYKKVLEKDPDNGDAQSSANILNDTLADIELTRKKINGFLGGQDFEKAYGEIKLLTEKAPYLAETLSPSLAEACAGMADKVGLDGKLQLSSELYRLALENHPEIGGRIDTRVINVETKLALEEIKKEDFTKAKDRLVYVTTLYPGYLYGRYALGVVHESLGEDAACRREYLAALGSKVVNGGRDLETKKMRGLVEEHLKLSTGAAASVSEDQKQWTEIAHKDLQTHESKHFIIRHHNDFVAKQAADTLELNLTRLSDYFKFEINEKSWPIKCEIILFKDKAEYEKSSKMKEWSGGGTFVEFREGKLVKNEIITYQNTPSLINSVLPHELTHVLLHLMLGESHNFPLWIHEGLAVSAEPVFRRSYYKNLYKNAVASGKELALEDLVQGKYLLEYPADDTKIGLYYGQSYLLVNMLVEWKGIGTFLDFCHLVRDEPTYTALSRHYGISNLQELETGWRNYCKKLQ